MLDNCQVEETHCGNNKRNHNAVTCRILRNTEHNWWYIPSKSKSQCITINVKKTMMKCNIQVYLAVEVELIHPILNQRSTKRDCLVHLKRKRLSLLSQMMWIQLISRIRYSIYIRSNKNNGKFKTIFVFQNKKTKFLMTETSKTWLPSNLKVISLNEPFP